MGRLRFELWAGVCALALAACAPSQSADTTEEGSSTPSAPPARESARPIPPHLEQAILRLGRDAGSALEAPPRLGPSVRRCSTAGNRIVTVGSGRAVVWDLETLSRVTVHMESWDAALTPDAETVMAIVSDKPTLALARFSAKDASLLKRTELSIPTRGESGAVARSFLLPSVDRAVVSVDVNQSLVDLGTGAVIVKWATRRAGIASATVSPDRQRIAIASADSLAVHALDGRKLRELELAPSPEPRQLVWAKGELLISSFAGPGRRFTVERVDLYTGKVNSERVETSSETVAWTPSFDVLLFADGQLRRPPGELLEQQAPRPIRGSVSGCALPDGKVLVAEVSLGGDLVLVRVADGARIDLSSAPERQRDRVRRLLRGEVLP